MSKFGWSLPPGCNSTPGEEEYDERHPIVQWFDYRLGCTIKVKDKYLYDGMGIRQFTSRIVHARLFNLVALDWSGHRHSWDLQFDCKHPFSRTPVHAENAHTILRVILGTSLNLVGFLHKGDRYRSVLRLAILTEKAKKERDPDKPRWEQPLKGWDVFTRYSDKIRYYKKQYLFQDFYGHKDPDEGIEHLLDGQMVTFIKAVVEPDENHDIDCLPMVRIRDASGKEHSAFLEELVGFKLSRDDAYKLKESCPDFEPELDCDGFAQPF